MKHLTPKEIESESMKIIEREAGAHSFTPNEWTIVKRIIHATADFEVMNTIRFHPQALKSGIDAIKAGRSIYTDTEMLAAAINRRVRDKYSCKVVCHVADEEVKKQSETSGLTRSAVALRTAAASLKGGIIAIGNAPTALTEALQLFQEGMLDPALVIGMPVGFVGAAESKEALLKSPLIYITMRGRKGGTPATVATLNALIQIAGGL